jgi:DUF218 domain
MSKIAIIHGYGIVDMEKPFYQTYIAQCVDYIQNNNIDTVICSGGFTNPNITISEAKSLQIALQNKGTQAKRILEENSLTTFENIQNIIKIVNLSEYDQVHILCSNYHLPKTMYLSLLGYDHYTEQEVLQIFQALIKKNDFVISDDETLVSKYDKFTFVWRVLPRDHSRHMHLTSLLATLIESHYPTYPQLHKEFIQWRKEQRWL